MEQCPVTAAAEHKIAFSLAPRSTLAAAGEDAIHLNSGNAVGCPESHLGICRTPMQSL